MTLEDQVPVIEGDIPDIPADQVPDMAAEARNLNLRTMPVFNGDVPWRVHVACFMIWAQFSDFLTQTSLWMRGSPS